MKMLKRHYKNFHPPWSKKTPLPFLVSLYLLLHSFTEQMYFEHLLCAITLPCGQGIAWMDLCHPHQRANPAKQAFHALHSVGVGVTGHLLSEKLRPCHHHQLHETGYKGYEQLCPSAGSHQQNLDKSHSWLPPRTRLADTSSPSLTDVNLYLCALF